MLDNSRTTPTLKSKPFDTIHFRNRTSDGAVFYGQKGQYVFYHNNQDGDPEATGLLQLEGKPLTEIYGGTIKGKKELRGKGIGKEKINYRLNIVNPIKIIITTETEIKPEIKPKTKPKMETLDNEKN